MLRRLPRFAAVGVIAVASLTVTLLLPVEAGSEGFPVLVDCRFPPRPARCQTHVSGIYPVESVLYRLQNRLLTEADPAHGQVLSARQFAPGEPDYWPPGGALILCMRPGRPVFSCVQVEGGQLVLRHAPTAVAMYVDAEVPPGPGP